MAIRLVVTITATPGKGSLHLGQVSHDVIKAKRYFAGYDRQHGLPAPMPFLRLRIDSAATDLEGAPSGWCPPPTRRE